MQDDNLTKIFDNDSRNKPFSGNEEYLTFLITAFEFSLYSFLENDKTDNDNIYGSKRLLALSQLETRLLKHNSDMTPPHDLSSHDLSSHDLSSHDLSSHDLSSHDLSSHENMIKNYILSRTLRTKNLSFNLICEKMHLDSFSAFCLIAAVYLFFEPDSSAIVQAVCPNNADFLSDFTFEAMARIYQKNEFSAVKNFSSISKAVKNLLPILPINHPELVYFATFSADRAIIDYLLCECPNTHNINYTLCDIGEYISSDLELPALYSNEGAVDEIVEAAKLNDALIVLTGRANCGKHFAFKKAASRLKISGYIFDARRFFAVDTQQRIQLIWQLKREARLCKISCMFKNIDEISEEIDGNEVHSTLSILKKNLVLLCISSDKENYIYSYDNSRFPLHININEPNATKRYELFCNFANGIPYAKDISLHEFANKYRFTIGQIKQAVENSIAICKNNGEEITLCALKESCRRLVSSGLGNRASLIQTPFDIDDVILPYSQKNQLLFACSQIKNQHIVYDQWGYGINTAYGKGTSMLLYGPPGTGKTMAASAVANRLGLELYRVDISKIVDKYIGETEKNIGEIFSRAKECSVVLFFDEADALFSKRSEVSNANDRNANMETGFLLQCIEDYDGICILATNYKQNIDAAFLRRIKFTVEFPFPQADIRRRLWEKVFPTTAPLDKAIDFDFLAENFELSGGNIKNIAVNSAFYAAQKNKIINMEAIINCVYSELTKQHIIADSSCFAQYNSLLHLS